VEIYQIHLEACKGEHALHLSRLFKLIGIVGMFDVMKLLQFAEHVYRLST
jgi:hypothetical protein